MFAETLGVGDKETFWIGFLLAGDESFAFHQGDAASMGTTRVPTGHHPAAAAGESADADEKNETLSDAPPKSYILCAPQLLHLDTSGKPLWFNGWLVDNKFADKEKRKFANFESYLVEPRELRDPTPWQLGESNMACLTSDAEKKFEFSQEEQDLLDLVKDHAHKIKMRD